MKKILYTLLLMIPLFITAQTQSENYVLKKTYKQSTNVAIGTQDPNIVNTTIQYYDGLGRPKQNIAYKAGGSLQDLVIPFVYDNFGRQSKEYLPYARTSNSLGYSSQSN